MSMGSSTRIHSMDALRASTMLLLVPVHAAVLISLNGHEGVWATAIYWIVHVFRLPLFFAMSGFFLALLLVPQGVVARRLATAPCASSCRSRSGC